MTRLSLAQLWDVARDHSIWTTHNVRASPDSLRVSSVWNCRCGALLADSWQALETIEAALEAHQLDMMEAALNRQLVNAPMTLRTRDGRVVASAEVVDGGATFVIPEPEQVVGVATVQGPR